MRIDVELFKERNEETKNFLVITCFDRDEPKIVEQVSIENGKVCVDKFKGEKLSPDQEHVHGVNMAVLGSRREADAFEKQFIDSGGILRPHLEDGQPVLFAGEPDGSENRKP